MAEEYITITHIVNPHCFWFHKAAMTAQDVAAISEIEDAISILEKENRMRLVMGHYEIDQCVTVLFEAWNKFIRARVLEQRTNLLWAIDYGFPFDSTSLPVYVLPPELAQPIEHVRCAGLANVDASELKLSFLDNVLHRTKSNVWQRRACQKFGDIINDAAAISFVERLTVDDRKWGDLFIYQHNGKRLNVGQRLIEENCAMAGDGNLEKRCRELTNIKIKTFLTCDNHSNYRLTKSMRVNCEFSPSSFSDEREQTRSPERCKFNISQKIEDWKLRNLQDESWSNVSPVSSFVDFEHYSVSQCDWSDSTSRRLNVESRAKPCSFDSMNEEEQQQLKADKVQVSAQKKLLLGLRTKPHSNKEVEKHMIAAIDQQLQICNDAVALDVGVGSHPNVSSAQSGTQTVVEFSNSKTSGAIEVPGEFRFNEFRQQQAKQAVDPAYKEFQLNVLKPRLQGKLKYFNPENLAAEPNLTDEIKVILQQQQMGLSDN